MTFRSIMLSLVLVLGSADVTTAAEPASESSPAPPASPPQSCLCAEQLDECLAPAALVFEGQAVSVAIETTYPGGATRICRADTAEPAAVDQGCVVARLVRNGCTAVARKTISLRGPGGPRREAETAADGLARWCGLPAGAYQLEAAGAAPVA